MGPPAKVELLLGTTRAVNMLNYGGLKSDCCPLSCPPRHGWEVISSRPLPSPESLDIGGVKEDWLTVGDLVEVKHGLSPG